MAAAICFPLSVGRPQEAPSFRYKIGNTVYNVVHVSSELNEIGARCSLDGKGVDACVSVHAYVESRIVPADASVQRAGSKPARSFNERQATRDGSGGEDRNLNANTPVQIYCNKAHL